MSEWGNDVRIIHAKVIDPGAAVKVDECLAIRISDDGIISGCRKYAGIHGVGGIALKSVLQYNASVCAGECHKLPLGVRFSSVILL